MGDFIELPIVEPMYSTYQYQGPGSAIITNNITIKNWYLNNAVDLMCNKNFLTNGRDPCVDIVNSQWEKNPYIDIITIDTRKSDKVLNNIIVRKLKEGYYIYFNGVDDYYVEGKSNFKVKHIPHDGCICGYDQDNAAYCLHSYDDKWIYKKFWTSCESFYKGKKAINEKGRFDNFFAIKPKTTKVYFNTSEAIDNIRQYLDSSIKKYPLKAPGFVYGTAVQDYIALYIEKMHNGTIAYELKDRRIFRALWEHKKIMLERIEKVEETLNINKSTSERYKAIVSAADKIRVLYIAHNIRRRDSVLPIIRKELIDIKRREREILRNFIKKVERKMAE